ncbi:MFS transporter [Nocardia albiluteola]|uniref:MFS transporter n=1 Tax=Nocardia albiluteola TaxID=2842303 RepID=UPI0027E1C4D4|nr:MFS transporter [Nocardia albiluteola]
MLDQLASEPAPSHRPADWIWRRALRHYPDSAARYTYLAITVLATIVLYYELYVPGAVATKIIGDLGFSFGGYVMVSVIGNAVGAFGSLAAGLADRWGRANLVVVGLFVTAAIVLFGLPHAPNKAAYLVLFAVLSVVEGIMLVATPALIRDFSPQLGRASAMGFWTMGPVLGSLAVTEISSNTLDAHPQWRFQFYVCGIIGFVIAAIAFVGLRELSPALRDQLMVSVRDRELIEARAAGLDPADALRHQWRRLLRLDVLAPAFGISMFLFFYYIAVGFFVVYFVTVFGYSEARANSLANWYWGSNAIALVVAGVLSDRIRVRKPFMILGTAISLAAIGAFATLATRPQTSYYEFAAVMAVGAIGGGVAYCAWMASFTETVERHNPAATATGLALWGWTIRLVVAISLAGFTLAVTAVSTLVDQGTRVAAIVQQYPEQVGTIGAVSPGVLTTLAQHPTDQQAGAAAVSQLMRAGLAPDPTAAAARLQQLATAPVPPADLRYLSKHAGEVTRAKHDNPHQWQVWWWVCFAAQLVFVPTIFLLVGRWSPRRAREDAERHQALVRESLAQLHRESNTD